MAAAAPAAPAAGGATAAGAGGVGGGAGSPAGAGGAVEKAGASPLASPGKHNPPNKPGEPEFQLKLEPDNKLVFKGDNMTEGTTTIGLKLTNPTKNRQTFKVKCTSNDIFRVRPPLGFVDAEATTPIKIAFTSKTVPESGRHFFAFYHMKSDEKDKPARQVWTPQSKPEGVRRVLVYFEKMDGTPATTGIPTAEGAPAAGGIPAAAGGAALPPAGAKPSSQGDDGAAPRAGAPAEGGAKPPSPGGGAEGAGAAPVAESVAPASPKK